MANNNLESIMESVRELFYEENLPEARQYILYKNIKTLADKAMKDISYSNEYSKYINLAITELHQDIEYYIDKKYPDIYDKYGFKISNKTYNYVNNIQSSLYLQTVPSMKQSNYKFPKSFHNLRQDVQNIRNYYVKDILGIDRKSALTKEAYERFQDIRKNKSYLIPYIDKIVEKIYLITQECDKTYGE